MLTPSTAPLGLLGPSMHTVAGSPVEMDENDGGAPYSSRGVGCRAASSPKLTPWTVRSRVTAIAFPGVTCVTAIALPSLLVEFLRHSSIPH